MAFAFSKLLWVFLSPGNLLTLLLAIGLILAGEPSQKWSRRGQDLAYFVCGCFIIVALFPVGNWALTPLENRFSFNPPAHVDGIIVIGGDEQAEVSEARGTPIALDSLRRYVRFAELARRYPDARLVFSGGSSTFLRKSGRKRDFEVARDIMTAIGVPMQRVTFEKKSRNTYENAVFAATIVHPNDAQNWLLVTSAWHMPRAIACFRKAGWNITAAPAGYFTTGSYAIDWPVDFTGQMHRLTMAVHEYIGLAAYKMMGRIDSIWPG